MGNRVRLLAEDLSELARRSWRSMRLRSRGTVSTFSKAVGVAERISKVRIFSASFSNAGAIKSKSPDVRVNPSFYRPELDSLRFLAFLGVFIQHSLPHSIDVYEAHGLPKLLAPWIASITMGGAYGVDLFFVLSAYLITELLQREFALTGGLDIRSFYIRRILRIWPLYFFFLALCILLTLLGMGRQHFGVSYALAFILLAGNWICAFKGYPASVAAPLWSVSLEEQFYLTWPVLMRLVRVRRLMIAAVSMLVLAFATRLVLLFAGIPHPGVWCNTFARLDPIACGIILAAWLKGRRPTLSTGTRALAGAGALSIWLVVARYAPLDATVPLSVLVGYPAVALAGSLLVVLFLACDLSKLPKLISSSGIYLGRISYGLYVYHLLAITIVGTVDRGGFATFWLSSLIITVVLSAISYRHLEQPFLRLKLRYTHVLSRPGG